MEKILEAILLVPELNTMEKWTLSIIYGRFYITVYCQVNILFESQAIMVFNEVPGKIFMYSYFPDQ